MFNAVRPLPALGIRLHGSQSHHSALAMARVADESGFRALWFAENAFARGILPLAGACAMLTRQVQIAAGVFNPFTRHPSLMAMEIGALDELSDGRAMLAVGSGVASALRKLGIDADKPLPALRDAMAIVRALLAGHAVATSGHQLQAQGVRLDFTPRPSIPVFLAGRGDLTIKLAGAVADGLIISNMCSVGYAQNAAQRVRAARTAGGRTDAPRIIQYMPCAVNSDRADATTRAKRAVGEMLPRFYKLSRTVTSARSGLLTGTGFNDCELEDVTARLVAGADAASLLDDRLARCFSLAGTPEDCMAQARTFAAAGVTDLALTFSGADWENEVRSIGAAFAKAGADHVEVSTEVANDGS